MRLAAGLFVLLTALSTAQAHFVWILPAVDGKAARIVFSEGPEPDDAKLLEKLDGKLDLFEATSAEPKARVSSKPNGDSLQIQATAKNDQVLFGTCRYGVLQKGGGAPFLLMYHAKSLGVGDPWKAPVRFDDKNRPELDIVATEKQWSLRVLWRGKPLANAEIVLRVPGKEEVIDARSGADGAFPVPLAGAGTYGVRVKHVDATASQQDGKAVGETRHYATLTFVVPGERTGQVPSAVREPQGQAAGAAIDFPALPVHVASFGATTVDDFIYLYGGHCGTPHQYSTETATGSFHRVSLKSPKAWLELPKGPPLQGMALVPHAGKVYRIGGMQSRNSPGTPADNNSLASFACYDPKANAWTDLPDLPAGRSSHDAAVVGDTIVVAGGWQMLGGDKESFWHKTALVLDLSKKSPAWESVEQPFRRRSVAMAAHRGKAWVLGGMDSDEGTVRTVDVFDPATKKWSTGPDLPAPNSNGFSPSACESGGRLYVSIADGSVIRLSENGDAWEKVSHLTDKRFVHRMVPLDRDRLLVLGGASKAKAGPLPIESVTISSTAAAGN